MLDEPEAEPDANHTSCHPEWQRQQHAQQHADPHFQCQWQRVCRQRNQGYVSVKMNFMCARVHVICMAHCELKCIM